MYTISNNKQLTKISYMRIGGQKMAQLLFSLVHLILCYALKTKGGTIWQQ